MQLNAVFIILHYLEAETTVSAVESVRSSFAAEPDSIRIVVVDNASPDGSGALLQDRYRNDSTVTVLLSERNEGFARGNNIGFRYAKARWQFRYMIFMNNDVLVDDPELFRKLDEAYAQYRFGVLGPDLLCEDGVTHQYDALRQPFTIHELEKRKTRYERQNRFFPLYYLLGKAKNAAVSLQRLFIHRNAPGPSSGGPVTGIVLFGSFLVFTAALCEAREYAFYPGTFLYYEEDILSYECSRDGYVVMYDPRIRVIHLNDRSSRAAFGSDYRLARFKNAEIAKSVQVLIDLMRRDRQDPDTRSVPSARTGI